VQYGMQSFDQSLMVWYQQGAISYESALFFSSNPSEFALRLSGIEGSSDRTFADQMGAQGAR
jgi:twitching motility protein PilT